MGSGTGAPTNTGFAIGIANVIDASEGTSSNRAQVKQYDPTVVHVSEVANGTIELGNAYVSDPSGGPLTYTSSGDVAVEFYDPSTGEYFSSVTLQNSEILRVRVDADAEQFDLSLIHI